MKKNSIRNKSTLLSHVHFSIRMQYLCLRSIQEFKKKYKGDYDTQPVGEAFILDSLLELFIRSKEGILLQYSNDELNNIFNDAIGALYNSQNFIIKKEGLLDSFGILFSLWEFEEQEDIFIKFFRYSYFYNFKNEKIDMPKLFFDSFGTNYSEYLSLALEVSLITIGADYSQFYDYLKIIEERHPIAFEHLLLTSEEYYNYSVFVCENIEDIAFSVKVSQSYPFIKHKNIIYLPLPHACITACTKSLLYRLTFGKDNIRRDVGKETMENYVFSILNGSSIYEIVSHEVFFDEKKKILSPDVLCYKDGNLFAAECKLLTPSSRTRLLDKESLENTKRILIEDICKLYKSLFIYYSCDGNGLPFVLKENRFGSVVLLERIDFDHRMIMKSVADKLGLNDEERHFLSEHIRFDSLYDIERLAFCHGNAIQEMRNMINDNRVFDFSISHSTGEKEYIHKDFISFKKDVLGKIPNSMK